MRIAPSLRTIFCITIALGMARFPGSTLASSEAPGVTWLLNRSILTVDKQTLSLFDVELLLLFWNSSSTEERVSLTTDWTQAGGFFLDKKKSFLRNYEKWPADARRILYIALNWPEAARLTSLSTTDEAKLELIRKAKSSPDVVNLSASTRAYLMSSPETRLSELADMVLRSRQILKSRGEMRESMGSILWFWHQKQSSTP